MDILVLISIPWRNFPFLSCSDSQKKNTVYSPKIRNRHVTSGTGQFREKNIPCLIEYKLLVNSNSELLRFVLAINKEMATVTIKIGLVPKFDYILNEILQH